MQGKVVVVTGASAGIGKETAGVVAGMGARVVMCGRDPKRSQAAHREVKERSGNPDVDLIVADFASMGEVRRVAAEIDARYDRLDVLLNNAGLWLHSRRETPDGFEATFAVNHLSMFLLTDLLLGKLKASAPSRVVIVSSNGHLRGAIDFDDLHRRRRYSGLRAYMDSKLANVYFAYELARRVGGSGVTSNALHPGMVRTRLFTGHLPWFVRAPASLLTYLPLLLSPARGAETPVYVATSPELDGVTGRYFVKRRDVPSGPHSYDEETAGRLWDLSAEMTGLDRR